MVTHFSAFFPELKEKEALILEVHIHVHAMVLLSAAAWVS